MSKRKKRKRANPTWLRIRRFLISRLQETSSWRNAILLLAGIGVHLKPEYVELIVAAGLSIAGIMGVIFPDNIHKPTPPKQPAPPLPTPKE